MVSGGIRKKGEVMKTRIIALVSVLLCCAGLASASAHNEYYYSCVMSVETGELVGCHPYGSVVVEHF